MRYHRFLIEIIVLGSAVAFVLALLLATLGAAAGAASSDHAVAQGSDTVQTNAQRSFDGMITCSSCGAKHPASLNRPATVCVRVCVHAGANFALVDDDTLYLLDGDREALKKVAGQRAHIIGVLHGHTIKVTSVLAES